MERTQPPADQPALERRLGTTDAVVLGLGSMLGAGVFAVWAPATRAAGAAVLLGLVLAAAVAYCNATASAQLAAAYPTSGGIYVYGRERLGEWWGFAAGWCFVVGCLVLAFSLPVGSVLAGVAVLAAGLAARALTRARRPRSAGRPRRGP